MWYVYMHSAEAQARTYSMHINVLRGGMKYCVGAEWRLTSALLHQFRKQSGSTIAGCILIGGYLREHFQPIVTTTHF
jgi:hypothetical protein